MQNKGKSKLEAALTEDTKFMFYPGMEIQIKPETRCISKDKLQWLMINGTLDLGDAFIIRAIDVLGHATKDMILQYLKLIKKHYPQKAVPNMDSSKLTKRLVTLAKNGMIAMSDYVTKNSRSVILIYTCTMFGHIFMKNTLDMSYISYDDNLLFHAEVETFKRLAAAAITLAMAQRNECVAASVNGKTIFGQELRFKDGYVYGSVEMEYNGESVLYLVEPVYFSINHKIISDEESMERTKGRMKRIESLVEQLRKERKMPVIPVFCVENMQGLKDFCFIAKMRLDAEVYEHSLYTSENALYRFDYELDEIFVSAKFDMADENKENRQVFIQLQGQNWCAFK